MERQFKHFPVSKSFKKPVPLPNINDIDVYKGETEVTGAVLCKIKTKGIFFDLMSPTAERQMALTKYGFLVIWMGATEGFVMDIRVAKSVLVVYENSKKYGIVSRKCDMKIKFASGTVNLFLQNDKINKWRGRIGDLFDGLVLQRTEEEIQKEEMKKAVSESSLESAVTPQVDQPISAKSTSSTSQQSVSAVLRSDAQSFFSDRTKSTPVSSASIESFNEVTIVTRCQQSPLVQVEKSPQSKAPEVVPTPNLANKSLLVPMAQHPKTPIRAPMSMAAPIWTKQSEKPAVKSLPLPKPRTNAKLIPVVAALQKSSSFNSNVQNEDQFRNSIRSGSLTVSAIRKILESKNKTDTLEKPGDRAELATKIKPRPSKTAAVEPPMEEKKSAAPSFGPIYKLALENSRQSSIVGVLNTPQRRHATEPGRCESSPAAFNYDAILHQVNPEFLSHEGAVPKENGRKSLRFSGAPYDGWEDSVRM